MKKQILYTCPHSRSTDRHDKLISLQGGVSVRYSDTPVPHLRTHSTKQRSSSPTQDHHHHNYYYHYLTLEYMYADRTGGSRNPYTDIIPEIWHYHPRIPLFEFLRIPLDLNFKNVSLHFCHSHYFYHTTRIMIVRETRRFIHFHITEITTSSVILHFTFFHFYITVKIMLTI